MLHTRMSTSFSPGHCIHRSAFLGQLHEPLNKNRFVAIAMPTSFNQGGLSEIGVVIDHVGLLRPISGSVEMMEIYRATKRPCSIETRFFIWN